MTPKLAKPLVIDVRELLANGDHPVPVLMQSLAALEPGQSVTLVTPFLPSPLILSLQSEGYSARPERRSDGSWQTHFSRR